MGRVLVIDDEASVLAAFRELLAGLGHEVETAGRGEEGLERFRRQPPDVVVTDLVMPGISGMDVFREIRAVDPKLPVIIMTGHGTMDTAIAATQLGAFDYQLKPFEPESMVSAIERALAAVRLVQRSVELNPHDVAPATDAIVGESPEMQEVYKAIGRVAGTDATVLIRGESGAGKELVARAIYQYSLRAAAPLLIVNCAALPETLLESELFGHERGAFTGAHARKIGKFEQAGGGSIFLDEIGDVPLSVQAKLLRVLQQRTVERVGGSESIQVDVRIMAATNRNLEEAIAGGQFREDLFHRLNVFTIQIPPLRDRRSDIPALANYFLNRYAAELKVEKPLLSHEALAALQSTDWPGNVRELEHCIYRALILTRGYPIQAADIGAAHNSAASTLVDTAQVPDARLWEDLVRRYLDSRGGIGAHEGLLGEIEKLLIMEALRRTDGNQTRAAQLLGLPRPTLHAKMQRAGIEPSRND